VTLTILFIVIVVINTGFFLFYSRFSFTNFKTRPTAKKYPVSLIVCARNEAENLKRHIPAWLSQNYPEFELVLVNDHSADHSLEVMESFAAKDDRIVIVDVKHNENFWGKKKYALTLGIRKARHTRLLLSDADCKPSGPNWLQNMTGQLNQEKQIVLGYGGYLKKPGLLNALIRFETVITAFQYFSSALLGRPYMGVGRNLSYTSNLFYEHAGFTAHMQIESGDDDLFVNQAATSQNTTVCLTPESFTWSIPKDSWRTWIRQKARHSSTAYLYKPFEKFWLGLYFVSNLAFWLILIIGLTLNWPLFLALGLTRFLLQYLLLAPGFKKLEEGQLLWALPLLELFLVLMQLVIFINSFKTIRWK